MIDLKREAIAYAIIALVLSVVVIWGAIAARRQRRRRLRQRGIKRYGH